MIEPVASLERNLEKNKLFEDILQPENLRKVWQRVKQNKGSAGIDGITLDTYPKWAQAHWANIKRGLEQGYYCPQPVKPVEIPKPNGGVRRLGIPCVNDRLIQQAIKTVQSHIKAKYRYAVDIDLSKFFDQVDHDLLIHRLGERINDQRVLALMGRYLRAGISDKGRVNPRSCGVPQGGPLSPLLANVMLDDLDRYLENKHERFARYADDFVIGVKTFAEGQRIKQEVETFLKTLKLPINQEKSQVVPMTESCFLGYQFKGPHLIWSPKSLQNF